MALMPHVAAALRSAQMLKSALPDSVREHWRTEAWQRPPQPRHALWLGPHCVGSVHAQLQEQIGLLRPINQRKMLQKTEHQSWGGFELLAQQGLLDLAQGWRCESAESADWAELAQALRDAGLCGPWRNETLAVRPYPLGSPNGQSAQPAPLAQVERGAVRVLGIATQAVHLIALTPEGDFWVQQRSLTKANDPGKWDTTMGGMVGGYDSWISALARETWEEAGLDLTDLDDPHASGAVQFSLPSQDGQGLGWMRETIAWTAAVLPAHLRPVNQDGEVAQFAAWSPREVAQGLAAGAFTLEASCVLADWCDQMGAAAP